HVLVEKPIAPTWDEYAEMRDAAAAAGLMLCEDYNSRFMPAVTRARDLVCAGRLGELVHLDVFYGGVADPEGTQGDAGASHFSHGLPGGMLHDFATHPVSVATAFVPEVRDVAVWQRRRHP